MKDEGLFLNDPCTEKGKARVSGYAVAASSTPAPGASVVQYPSTTATGAPARPTIVRPTIARPTIAGTSTGNTTATLKCIPTGYALSLSRMFDGVSRDEIKEYMVEMGVTPTYVSVLPKKWDDQLTRMAKVVVKQEDKETVMDPSFWPKSCVIRERFNKPRQ